MRPKLRLTDEGKRSALKTAWEDEGCEIERERLQAIKLAHTGQHTLAR